MLFDLYKKLCENAPQAENETFGLPVGRDSSLWLTIDHQNYPAVLLPSKLDDLRPDIILRSVDVHFSRVCSIQTAEGKTYEGCYSIVCLKETDPDIVRLFLRILEERFHNAEPPRTNATLAENIQEIASLFSQVSVDARDVVGLWGELFAIIRASDIESAVRSWSSKGVAKYDFVTDSFVLDVKATLSSTPKHRFSLDQLRPPRDYDAYIFSVCLVEQHAGRTAGEMMDSIAERITDAGIRDVFLRLCLVKGGREIYRSELRLQVYPEAGSFGIYRSELIPVPSIGTNDPISDVRFSVDLSNLEPVSPDLANQVLSFPVRLQ